MENQNNQEIFKYLLINQNNKLSDLNGLDLQEFLVQLSSYYIYLRKKINLKKDITFGLEIEFEKSSYKKILKNLVENELHNNWIIKSDGSLTKGNEINSPILIDKVKTWEELNKVLKLTQKNGKIINKSGGHVHVGAQILGDNKEYWLNFIKLWSVYENIIYRFTYGQYLSPRPLIRKYADLMSDKFWRIYNSTKDDKIDLSILINTLSQERNQAVNFENVRNYTLGGNKKTIEFRCPNGTLDPVIWQNNVNLFTKLLLYCKDTNFNNDIIDNRHNIIDGKYDHIKWYNEIYIDQALELCDLIFTNNLDKINFLKQYLKSFETVNVNKYIKTKKFTKQK